MKANYKVVNNRQAQLKKVIQNFEPTGVCAFLMFRYYVMQLMAESEAAGGLNVPLSDSAERRMRPFRIILTLTTNLRMSPSISMALRKNSPRNLNRTFSWLWLATLSTHSSIFRMSPVSAVGTSSWLSQNLCPNTNRQKERSTDFVTTNMRSDEL